MKNKNLNFSRQKLELLALKPEFQEDVFAFRKKWKIPKGGFKDNKEMQKYGEWLGEISDEYRDSEVYNKKRSSLFDKLDDATNRKDGKLYRNTEEKIRTLEMKMPLNVFFNDQKIISSKYNLSENYKNSLDVFLRSGNFYPHHIPQLPIRIWYEKDPENKGKKKIFIEIYGETTIKDVQRVWSMIKRWQKETIDHREGRKRSKVYFDIQKRIYDLHLDKKKSKEISEIIKGEFGRSFAYDEIGKIINRFKHGIMDT